MRPLLTATAGALLLPSLAIAQSSHRMAFQLAARGGPDLAVTVEYLDPSAVHAQLGASRALPVSMAIRNQSAAAVPFDPAGVRLHVDDHTALRPGTPGEVANDVRKMKNVPGFVRAIVGQSTTFHPGAVEAVLEGAQIARGALAPGETRTGLLVFLLPPAFSGRTSDGLLLLDVPGRAPQMLTTTKVSVETKAPEQPGFATRLSDAWKTYLSPTPPSFNKSYALVVGIGRYRQLPPLTSPALDVRKVKAYLDAQGFDEVVTLLDEQVTPGTFRRPQLYFQSKLQKNDRFVFYYSGHGISSGTGLDTRGYLPLYDETNDGRHARSIAMVDLVSWLKGLPAEHLLVVLDSCFSGLAVDGTEIKSGTITAPNPHVDLETLQRMSRGPARYLLMAGSAGQESLAGSQWSGSLFTQQLIVGLQRDADLYKDHIVTARELYLWLQQSVYQEARRVKREMTPMFLDLGPGASRGEFVFVQ